VSSKRRKQRKAHFSAPSHKRQKLMRATLSKNLRTEFNVRSEAVVVGDTVNVIRGIKNPTERGTDISGKVVRVCRKKFAIYIDKFMRQKTNGQEVHIPIHPSNCVITQFSDLVTGRRDERKKRLERRGQSSSGKGKVSGSEISRVD